MTGAVGHGKGRAAHPPQKQGLKDKADRPTSTAPNRPTWAVVILNWNKSALTLNCMDSVDTALSFCPALTACLIVVDNGSDLSEHTSLAAGVQERDPWHLLSLRSNTGFAAGMNAGYREALSRANPEKILFLNNDVSLAADAFTALLREETTVGLATVTGLILASESSAVHKGVRGYRYWPWLGLATRVTRPDRALDYISGAAMLIDHFFLERIGGVPSDSFLYFEELRLVMALQDGERFSCATAAAATHSGGATANTELRRRSRHYYAALSCFRFTRDHYPAKLPTVVVSRLAGLLVLGGLKGQLAPAYDAGRALLDFVAGTDERAEEASCDGDASY